MNNYLLAQDCVFAFNIWDFHSAKSVIDAAAFQRKSVILQTSSAIFQKMDAEEFRLYVTAYMAKKNIDVWLHLDHCKDMKTIYHAINCGWDSVMLDASDLPLAENIGFTKSVMEEAHKKGVLVEAEVGQIKGTEEEIQVSGDLIADKKEIQCFLQEIKPDMFAAAFGNAHGIYKGNPRLHFELIDYIAELTDIPFVVHGGSGLGEEVLKKLIQKSNVKKINISTEVKMAYRKGILSSMEQGLLKEEGFQADRVENEIYNAIYTMAREKIELLGGKS